MEVIVQRLGQPLILMTGVSHSSLKGLTGIMYIKL